MIAIDTIKPHDFKVGLEVPSPRSMGAIPPKRDSVEIDHLKSLYKTEH